MLLEGIFTAVPTSYYGDGRVYAKKIEHNVGRYGRTPVAGMVVLGSTGEAVMLDDEETREVLRAAVDAASADKVMLAGVGMGSAPVTLRWAEYVAGLGYDAVLIRTPHYYGPQMSPLAMLTYYRTVADRSPLPVVLYTIPRFTHYELPTAVIAELAGHPNIVGLKDSSGNVEELGRIVRATANAPKRTTTVTHVFTAVTGRMLAPVVGGAGDFVPADTLLGGGASPAAVAAPPALKTRTREVGFQVMSGSAEKLLASLEAGASGAVLALAACVPQALHEVYIAWKENDLLLAREKQARLVEASAVVAGRYGIAGIKYACDLNGYYGGSPRLPLLALTGAERAEVERVMQDLRN